MDIIGLINSIFSSQDFIFRFVLIILLSIYGLFALVIAIQIGNLNKVVNQIGFWLILNVFAIAHFFAAIALLVVAVLFL